jgi:hypothetical protein
LKERRTCGCSCVARDLPWTAPTCGCRCATSPAVTRVGSTCPRLAPHAPPAAGVCRYHGMWGGGGVGGPWTPLRGLRSLGGRFCGCGRGCGPWRASAARVHCPQRTTPCREEDPAAAGKPPPARGRNGSGSVLKRLVIVKIKNKK